MSVTKKITIDHDNLGVAYVTIEESDGRETTYIGDRETLPTISFDKDWGLDLSAGRIMEWARCHRP